MERLDFLVGGLGFLETANGKATVVSNQLYSKKLRVLAEIGLADCYYHPDKSEAVLIRRRWEGFPFGFHYISDDSVFSTKKIEEISKLEEYASSFSNSYFRIDRTDLQHFQAMTKRLSTDKLIRYLEPESNISKAKNKPVMFWKYGKLVDAMADIEGTKDDVGFFRSAKHEMKVFIGDLGEQMHPFRGLTGTLAFEEMLKRDVKVEIVTGPYISLGKEQKTKPFEWYFGKTYKLKDGEVTLLLTEGNSMRIKDKVYINQNDTEKATQLLYDLASEADEVCPILCDPAIMMLSEAYKKQPYLGILLALNRVMMYRGGYHGAAEILLESEGAFVNADEGMRSDFYVYLADALFRSGEIEKAEATLNSGLIIKGNNDLAYLLLGCINQVKGDYNNAIDNLEKSLAINTTDITGKTLERTRRAMSLM